jgi:hypothetical protein
MARELKVTNSAEQSLTLSIFVLTYAGLLPPERDIRAKTPWH